MARIRSIKPDFFKNEQLAELPAITRLLFIGLWTQADKEGRMVDRPKRLKAEIFPYDNVNIDTELSRLQSAGFIERYEVGEMKVIQVNKFTKHQRITGSEALTISEYPAPPTAAPECEEAGGNTEENFGNTLETPSTTGKEGKGKEGKGKEGKGEGSKNQPPPSEQFGNSVYKNIDELKVECLKDQVYFVEHISRQLKISPETVPKCLDDFNSFLRSTAVTVKAVTDYRVHFQNWLKKRIQKDTSGQNKETQTLYRKADASRYQ